MLPNSEALNIQNVLELLATKNYPNPLVNPLVNQIAGKSLYDQNNLQLLQDYINESQLLNTNQLLQNPLLAQTLNLFPIQNQIPSMSEAEQQKAYKIYFANLIV